MTSKIFHRVVPSFIDQEFNTGPFFLCYLDLHASNVIIDPKLEVVAILDWEFAAALPAEIACAPPKCLTRAHIGDLTPGTEDYTVFNQRLSTFIGHVESLLAAHVRAQLSGQYILHRLNLAHTEREFFFAKAASDYRAMFDVVWDHLVVYANFPIDYSEEEERQKNTELRQDREAEAVKVALATFCKDEDV